MVHKVGNIYSVGINNRIMLCQPDVKEPNKVVAMKLNGWPWHYMLTVDDPNNISEKEFQNLILFKDWSYVGTYKNINL